MRFSLIAVAGLVAAAQAQSVCFDDFDCLFAAAGKKCIRKGASITGICGKASATTLSTTVKPTATKSAAPGKATGPICFDDFDCLIAGGKCKRKGASITGNCAK